MPITSSASKKMRQDVKRRRVNRLKRQRLKDAIKTIQKEATEKNIKNIVSLADKAAKINLIHKNKAARIKSQLSKLSAKKDRQEKKKKKPSVKRGTVKTRKSPPKK